MKQTPDLTTLALFIAVADSGGLSQAARATGSSVPTLSRKMAALEQNMGQKLFLRGPRGYALSSDGAALLRALGPLREVATRLKALATQDRPSRVRITAGNWTTRYLAKNIRRIWQPADNWVPEFLANDQDVDIARRAADIGIRNRRPTKSWLAGRKAGMVEYAPFAVSQRVSGWITLAEDQPAAPSQAWLRSTYPDESLTTVSDMRVGLDLARAGVGQILLPRFVGRAEADLVQTGDVVAELTSEQWLVSHHDGRHDPPVRTALDRIYVLFTENDALSPQ